MKEFLVLNEDNSSSKNYGIYYTVNDRYYVIYTNMEKDENGYVILRIAKVLKEVNNTPEGIVPTGRYIGIDMPDQSEWDNVKTNISEIIANKQNNAETSVTYLPINEIDGINIKSFKSFRLIESIVNSIIEKDDNKVEVPTVDLPVVDEPVNDISIETPSVEELTPVTPVLEDATPMLNEDIPANEDLASIPTIAPNPFEMSAEPVIPEPVVEEEKPVNPYDVLQQQRTEEMLSNLATDDMKDIVSGPAIPVDELENKIEEPKLEIPTESEVDAILENTPSVEENVAPVEPVVEEEKTASNESFVDSIVADVSDILANNNVPVAEKKEEIKTEDETDYEQLYNDALEKTVELEKELKELHSKLNNIKNIVE